MSFPWLVARKGVLRSWHPGLCRGCLLTTQVARSRLATTTTATAAAATLQPQVKQAVSSASTPATTKMTITMTPLARLREKLQHPPVHEHTRATVKRQREYRRQLVSLYQSVRKDMAQWQQLTHEQLHALFQQLVPRRPIDTSMRLANKNAQQILLDMQLHTPHLFTRHDARLLLACYKDNRQKDDALQLLQWAKNSAIADDAMIETTLALMDDNDDDFSMAHSLWQEMACKTDRATGYMLKLYVSRGELAQAAQWWRENAKVLPVNTTHNERLVVHALDGMLRDATERLDFLEARHTYQVLCRLMQKLHRDDDAIEHPMGGIVGLANKAMVGIEAMTNGFVLLQDAMQGGHARGVKMLVHRLFQASLRDDNVRQAMDLYNAHPQLFHHDIVRSLLGKACRARYSLDAYRLYQGYAARYPAHMDIRLYTKVIKAMVRTRNLDLAKNVYHDAINNRSLTPHQPADATLAFFSAVYSICAQTGDVGLFENTIAMQQAAGFPELSHHALTSLASTFITAGQLQAAKTVFDHLAHSSSSSSMMAARTASEHQEFMEAQDGLSVDQQQEDAGGVDVVDFNILIRGLTKETQHSPEVMQERVLAVLNHMSLVGIASDSATLRTLLDIYATIDRNMADELLLRLLNDKNASRADHIWLNNLQLTRRLHDGINNSKNSKNRSRDVAARNASHVAHVFLANRRRALFLSAPRDEPIAADNITYALLLDALAPYPPCTTVHQQVYDHMRNLGWRPSLRQYTDLIRAWIRKGRVPHALAVVNDVTTDLHLPTAPPTIHATVIKALLSAGKTDRAREYAAGLTAQCADITDPQLATALKRLEKQ
ncbi:hypothetical protein BC940DRAFT_297551 [Gongronella butleri]|nr:hypothetical protein BC940DRAFT_297551 [Gongronella butleri]